MEKIFELRDGLAREGLFDVERILQKTPAELFDSIKHAGYTRGNFMVGRTADRLFQMADKVACEGAAGLLPLIAAGASPSLDEWPLSIKGVGPVVLQSFKTLRGL